MTLSKRPRGTHRFEHLADRPLPQSMSPRPGHPLALALMSAVIPGSGHLYAGRRRVGWMVFAVWFLLCAGAAAVLLLVPQDELLGYAVQPAWLLAAMVAAAVSALALVAVIVTAYRLGHPRRLPPLQRAFSRTLVLMLCVAVALPPAMLASYANLQRNLISDIFPDDAEPFAGPEQGQFGADPWTGRERLNVLLVGGDGAKSRTGVRADSITVASIDTNTGNTAMFSLPRNLTNAPFIEGTPAAEAMPSGFPEYVFGAYNYGAANPDLFPNEKDPGAAALSSVVSETLGLRVHYYTLVNMHGFRDMINALGGIQIRVVEPVTIGEIDSDTGKLTVRGHIGAGLRRLNGYNALWYARSRADSDDYGRMSRQRCVLGALARQADPITVLRNYKDIAAATGRAVSTNIPQGRLPSFVTLATKIRNAEISSFQFVPPFISPTSPDIDLIQEKVQAVIAKSEQQGSGSSSSGGSTKSGDASGAQKVEDVCTYE